jgi:hypothetical protein
MNWRRMGRRCGSNCFEGGTPMDGSRVALGDIRGLVSPEEWQLRVDLAACYRLVAHYRWDDVIFTHVSARLPGPEHHFLINPYGMLFDEITASSLVKIDLEGRIVLDNGYLVNPAGYHPQRDPCRARGRAMRAACAYPERRRGLGPA